MIRGCPLEFFKKLLILDATEVFDPVMQIRHLITRRQQVVWASGSGSGLRLRTGSGSEK